MGESAFQLFKVIAVVTLVCVAAAIATPPGRLPLVLRGVLKTLGRQVKDASGAPVPAWKKIVAFLLVLVAAAVAMAGNSADLI